MVFHHRGKEATKTTIFFFDRTIDKALEEIQTHTRMFHQRAAITFGGDSASQNVNVLRSSHHQNENLIHRGKASSNGNKNNDGVLGGMKPAKGLSKTPHGKTTSSRRRAFGDISNKKANNNGFGKESSSSLKRNTQQIEVLKPRSSNLLPRSVRKASTLQSTQFAILPEPVNSIKPIQISKTTVQVKDHRAKKVEPLPDIERTAGRTWTQQLQYDLKDEDDLASVSTIESLLDFDGFSPQEMWEKERDLLWKQRTEANDKEDRQIKEKMKAMMDREQKEAEEELDNLYDTIDNLEIFSTASRDSDLSEFDMNIPDDLSLTL